MIDLSHNEKFAYDVLVYSLSKRYFGDLKSIGITLSDWVVYLKPLGQNQKKTIAQLCAIGIVIKRTIVVPETEYRIKHRQSYYSVANPSDIVRHRLNNGQ
jgi:hypothetical protein